MSSSGEVLVDFVARGETDNQWLVVLVEQGPMEGSVDDFLHKLQNRLYESIDAVIDGKLAEKFPESQGKEVVIRVDCYDLPQSDIESFFTAFSNGALETADYRDALQQNRFVSEISFEINFDKTS